MIDLTKIAASDAERAAYISGNIDHAVLLARIDDLEQLNLLYERALDAIIEGVETQSMTLEQCASAAQAVFE